MKKELIYKGSNSQKLIVEIWKNIFGNYKAKGVYFDSQGNKKTVFKVKLKSSGNKDDFYVITCSVIQMVESLVGFGIIPHMKKED